MSRLFVILVLLAAGFSASPLGAEGLDAEQLHNAQSYLAHAVDRLQADADTHIDFTLEALAGAYQGSVYQGRRDADGFRREIVETGARLKADIARVGKELKEAEGGKNAAEIIVLLSREQVVNLKLYRWLTRVTEMTDLAHALSKTSDSDMEKFLTKMIQTHENEQDATEDVIQAIAAKTCDHAR